MSMMARRTVWIRAGLSVLLALLAAASPLEATETGERAGAAISEFHPHWRPLFKGVDFATGRADKPVPQAAFAVRVDLREPTIAFLATPSNGDQPLETNGRKTTTFLEEFGLQLALNASPFSPVLPTEGTPRDIQGLCVSRGDAYSKPHATRRAVLISRDNRVTFAQPPPDFAGVHNAVGGFGMLLVDGRNVGGDGERHPRTALGTSEDGRFLYILVIDGRQGDYSAGATTAETAAWLLRLAAHDALNLDGGGSTTLAIADGGDAKILNRPIHNGIPGRERVVGNHLGVFARTLEGHAPRGEP